MHAFLVSSIALGIGLCAVGLLLSRLPRLSAAMRHWLLSASLLVPCLAIAIAAFDPPNPFARAATGANVEVAITQLAAANAPSPPATNLPLYVWLAGTTLFLMMTVRSLLRWTRIARQAVPFHHAAFEKSRVRLAVSPAATEPMVVGLFRPVVLLPVGYAGDLDARALASVFAHELAHVERRDNTTALLHELICALFWFDPLHWLARRRLLDLRERACDERVLDLGCDAESYLDALARSCHAAIEAPAVACMSGFHVRERMNSIMTYTTERPRFLPSTIVRVSALTIALAIAATFALFAPAPPAFAGADASRYTFDVESHPQGEVWMHHVVIRAPGGEVVSESRVSTQPKQSFQVSGNHGTHALRIAVAPRPEGALLAVLEVMDGALLLQRDEKEIPIEESAPAEENAAAIQTPGGKTLYRIGGDIKAPKIITRVDPIYPGDAKEARISGVVIVEAHIDETGVVSDTRVLKPLPMGLDQAAVDAVKQWVFEPALKDGKPVPVIFNLTVNFRLD
ncbi:MAG TPA: M56 family metallopeptidase [Thermoanaerobaculia bacterium]|nr:M56 family metallopeptidase [Thermoanaerobaculia bacterium]